MPLLVEWPTQSLQARPQPPRPAQTAARTCFVLNFVLFSLS